ncbi:MAG: amidase [Bryobacteraceae bacterium]
MTIVEAGQAQTAGKVSSEELVRESLAAIERENPRLNAFLTVLGDRAMARAKELDKERAQGELRSPLHGVPVAVKDVFCMKGVRTTCGSKIFTDYIPGHDAAVVERLEAAGAVIVGKTTMHELAYGVTSNNPHFGAVRNPWDTDRIPGGSSGGSGAAVGAGVVPMAMGSDTGGSIRIPAAFCGTVGLKPTTGRVSRYGVLPLDFTLDHMGPLTVTVADAAVCLQVLAGFDARDDSSSSRAVDEYFPRAGSLEGLRVGVPTNFYFERVDPEIERAVRGAIERAAKAGARLVDVRVPDIQALNTVSRVVLMAEASSVVGPYLKDRSLFGADVLAMFDQGRLVAATDYINAQRLRRQFQQEFAKLFETIDCLVTPACPVFPAKIGQLEVEVGGKKEDTRLATTRFVRGINMIGYPAMTMPCGVSSGKLPMSVQLVGRPFEEALVLRVGAALE